MYTYIELGKKKKDELLEIVGDLEIEGVDETSTRAEIADAIIKFQKEQEKQEREKAKKEEVKMADIKKPEEKKPTTTTTSKPTVPAKPEAPKKKYGWL